MNLLRDESHSIILYIYIVEYKDNEKNLTQTLTNDKVIKNTQTKTCCVIDYIILVFIHYALKK